MSLCCAGQNGEASGEHIGAHPLLGLVSWLDVSEGSMLLTWTVECVDRKVLLGFCVGEEAARLWELGYVTHGEDVTVHVSIGQMVLSGCMISELCSTFAISSEQSPEEVC